MTSFVRKHIQTWEAYVPGEQPPPSAPGTADNIIKLNTNENTQTLPAIYTALAASARSALPPLNRYPDPNATALRAAAAQALNIAAEQLVFANGSDELIAACLRAFLDPADAMIVSDPSYNAYSTYGELYNIAIQRITLDANFSFDPKLLSTLSGKVVFLAHPHAPSGSVFPAATLSAMLKTYRTKLFIIDEAYADFHNHTLLPLVGYHPNLIVLRTLSKAFGLAGLRVGYAASIRENIQALRKVLDPYNLSALAQTLATTAFTQLDALQVVIRKIIDTRENFTTMLNTLGFTTIPSAANFVLTRPSHFSFNDIAKSLTRAHCPASASSPPMSQTAQRACQLYKLLKTANILVRYFPQPRLNEYLRITIGTATEMQQVIAKLKSWHQPT